MRKSFLSVLFFLAIVSAASGNVNRFKGRSSDTALIKVLLASKVRQLVVSSEGGFVYQLPSVNKKMHTVVSNRLLLSVSNGALSLGKARLPGSLLLLRPNKSFFLFNKRKYRGDCLIFLKGGRLSLVNLLSIESYLKGVLPHEINPNWALETLKAQAIAARSFAYVKMRENKKRFYDLDCTAFSQVYKGMTGEKQSTNHAVDETAGLVLYYGNRVAVGFFHACCGGMTENSGNVWNIQLSYLKAKKSPYCKRCKYYRWGLVLGQSDMKRYLRVRGKIIAASIRSEYRSGRVRYVVLKNKKGKTFWYSGRRFRALIGYNRLRSALFRVRMRGPYLQILGRGWGHGVGLCQWCAAVMGRNGMTAFQILRHFYRGIKVKHYRVHLAWK